MKIGRCPVKRTTSAFLNFSCHCSSKPLQILWCSLWFLSLLSLTCSTDPQHKHIIFMTPFSHHLQGPTDFSAMAINTNLSSLQVFQNRNNFLIVRSPLKWGILRRIKLSSPCCSVERPSYSRNITFYTEGSLTF